MQTILSQGGATPTPAAGAPPVQGRGTAECSREAGNLGIYVQYPDPFTLAANSSFKSMYLSTGPGPRRPLCKLRGKGEHRRVCRAEETPAFAYGKISPAWNSGCWATAKVPLQGEAHIPHLPGVVAAGGFQLSPSQGTTFGKVMAPSTRGTMPSV